jgi:DNA polymerase III sliding clamp (beta) subunit (PCNA family)
MKITCVKSELSSALSIVSKAIPSKPQTPILAGIFMRAENNILEIPNLLEVQEKTKKQVSICLETDDKNSFTHKKVLESVNDPENTVLEFPLSQLFQKY